MSGIVVTNNPIDPGQQPFKRGPVHIELVTGSANGAGYTATQSIIETFTTQTDDSGNWSATLTPTNAITPANTHYRVNEGGYVSLITVPDSGGPYNLSQLLVTNPPTPAAPGITGVQVAVGGTVDGVRPEINLIAGSGMLVSGVDNPGSNRVDVTLQSTGGASPASTVQPGTSYGVASAVGTDLTYAREDHQHGTPSLTSSAPATTEGIGQAAAVGTATTPARADHVHPLAAAGTPGSSAVGDTAATGTATTFAASDHKHGREAFATPGSSAVGDAAAAGASASVSHADHVHGREAFGAVSALPSFGGGNTNGSAATVSHSDHVHGLPSLPAATTSAAGIVQFDGTAADIAALGTQAAGSVGKVADAGHVHPNTGIVIASLCDMYGLGLLTADPLSSGYTVAQPPGLMSCFLCMAPKAKTVSILGIDVTAAGVTPSGLNALALYTEAGVLIDQTGDMTAAFESVGYAEGTLGSSHTLTPGANYYICVITDFTGSQPHLAATGTSGSANLPALNGHYVSLFKTGQASFPASFTPSAFSINSGNYIAYAR